MSDSYIREQLDLFSSDNEDVGAMSDVDDALNLTENESEETIDEPEPLPDPEEDVEND